MTFEEIMKIDKEPFDSDVIDELCDPEMMITTLHDNILACLIEWYYKIFQKEYHLNLGVSGETFIISKIAADDGDYEWKWINVGWNLFVGAMKMLDWSYLIVPTQDDNNNCLKEGLDKEESEEKWAETELLKWVEPNQEDVQDSTDMLKQERNLWLDASNYLEYGSCLFFWNDKLSFYLSIKNKNPEQTKAICEKEYVEIENLLNSIWYPLHYYHDKNNGLANRRYYGVQSMGFNGQCATDFNCFNPNWVTQAFVLDRILTLALSKIHGSEMDMTA